MDMNIHNVKEIMTRLEFFEDETTNRKFYVRRIEITDRDKKEFTINLFGNDKSDLKVK